MKIEGRHLLEGEIRISGAKNSAVALIPASLLADGPVTIYNVPDISDISVLNEILSYLKINVQRKEEELFIDPTNAVNKEIPYEITQKLRASYYFMAALLAKYKHVEMYFPGGCSIGARPIDQTLKGFKSLGATVKVEDGKYIIDAEELIGGRVYLDMPSVGATINTLLVATKAKGETIIENAAKEPEIVNVATFLNQMGAKITGAGTSEIRVTGVESLSGCFIEVIPDRIEAGTYIIAGALMGNNLKISHIIPEHVETLLLKLMEMGVNIKIGLDYVILSKTNDLKAITVKTMGYPGFPTDLQQPLTTLLITCQGESTLEETIYENRFQNVEYLNKMGANITISDDNHKITVMGPSRLREAEIVATDLRAGACLVLAALIAEGTTTIKDVEHILRGYENMIGKLKNVGAKIAID